MLIAVYYFFKNVVLPQLAANVSAALPDIMVIVLILTGITIVLGAVGMKISTGLGSTVANNLFKALGYIGRQIIQAIGWIFTNLLPRIYRWARSIFTGLGLSSWLCNLLSAVATLLALVIII